MKPKDALANLIDWLRFGHTRYNEGITTGLEENKEEIETLGTVVNAFPVLLHHLEKANYNWKEYDYESEELQESMEFLARVNKELNLE